MNKLVESNDSKNFSHLDNNGRFKVAVANELSSDFILISLWPEEVVE